jgi:hypothetical protein
MCEEEGFVSLENSQPQGMFVVDSQMDAGVKKLMSMLFFQG